MFIWNLIKDPELRALIYYIILYYTLIVETFLSCLFFTSIRAPVLRLNSILFFFYLICYTSISVIIKIHNFIPFYSILNSKAIFVPCLFEM